MDLNTHSYLNRETLQKLGWILQEDFVKTNYMRQVGETTYLLKFSDGLYRNIRIYIVEGEGNDCEYTLVFKGMVVGIRDLLRVMACVLLDEVTLGLEFSINAMKDV